MTRVAILTAAVAFLAVGVPQPGTASQAKSEGTSEQTKKQPVTSLKGCVDQQEGLYVLVGDHDLRVVANLNAEGFPIEGFAKHVGQKVTVRGTQNPGDTRLVFRVRNMETVSETCQQQSSGEGRK
jgi:hypothetical protein